LVATFRKYNNSSQGVSTAVVVGTATARNVATTNIATRIKKTWSGHVSATVALSGFYATTGSLNLLQGMEQVLVFTYRKELFRCSCCLQEQDHFMNAN
jgi:hypothetical protein